MRLRNPEAPLKHYRSVRIGICRPLRGWSRGQGELLAIPRGFRVRHLPDHRGHDSSEASSEWATPEPLSRAVDSVRRAHRRRGPFGAGRHQKSQSRVRGSGRAVWDHGLHVSWPVSAEIVSMAIMGATKSKDSSHTLFVSVRAVESGLLDGLIAHEMGHMLRTESGHPSHSAEVFRALSREVRIPRAAEGAFGQAFNHIQDIYADDLAFLVFATDGDDRAYEFFSGWIEG